jgi:hypothetical protein
MRVFLLLCAAVMSFAATLLMNSSSANAVFWRGITAPTNMTFTNGRSSKSRAYASGYG